jgi:hypothetical protein
MVEAGAVEKPLGAYRYEGLVSTRPKAILRYRNLALTALEAKAAKALGGLRLHIVIAIAVVAIVVLARRRSARQRAERTPRRPPGRRPWRCSRRCVRSARKPISFRGSSRCSSKPSR